MSEMVEKVADAVLADLTGRGGIRQAFDEIDDEVMDEIRSAIGRAAIEAMREPTEAMVRAVSAADQQEPFSDRTMRGMYCGMIDAALAGPLSAGLVPTNREALGPCDGEERLHQWKLGK